MVVVCSVGVDLDVIPYATDARRLGEDGPGVGGGTTETMVVLPSRDLVPVTAELAGLLDQAVALVSCLALGLIAGLDGGRTRRLDLDPARLRLGDRADDDGQATIGVLRRHLLGIETGAEGEAALPAQVLGLHAER